MILLKLQPLHLAGEAATQLRPAQVLEAALPHMVWLRLVLYCC